MNKQHGVLDHVSVVEKNEAEKGEKEMFWLGRLETWIILTPDTKICGEK